MARTTFSGPVTSSSGFEAGAGSVIKVASYLKTAMPNPVGNTGGLIYVTDAATGATVAYSNGTNWLRVDTSAIIS